MTKILACGLVFILWVLMLGSSVTPVYDQYIHGEVTLTVLFIGCMTDVLVSAFLTVIFICIHAKELKNI